MNINSVTISGNLVADCEKKNAGQTPLVTFVVAVNESKRTGENTWEDYPNFIECNLFGNRAKALADNLTKGTKVFVSGKLYQSRWQKDGVNMSKVSITVDRIEIGYSRTPVETKGKQEEIPW